MPDLFADFDAARLERRREREPAQFRLGGETFTCLPVVPIGFALDLATLALGPEDDPDIAAAYALTSFIDNVLVDEDRPRFQELLRRRDDAVDPDSLWEIVKWFAEVYAGRPTVPPRDSSSSPPTTGNGLSSPPGPRSAKRSRRSPSASD